MVAESRTCSTSGLVNVNFTCAVLEPPDKAKLASRVVAVVAKPLALAVVEAAPPVVKVEPDWETKTSPEDISVTF